MKWYEIIALGFIGALLYVWARGRKMDSRPGDGTTAPVDHDSLTLSIGFIHAVDAEPRRNELIRAPLETSNCAIPLAADYLYCAPEYVPAISPNNTDCYDFGNDVDWGIRVAAAQSEQPIGVGGPDVQPNCLLIPERVSCNPDIPGSVPGTEVV